jgi:hypothetical protein
VPMTAAQICTRSAQIAKCPGYTSQAGQSLNAILQELAQTYDFDTTSLIATGTFNLSQVSGPGNQYIAGCGPNPLPANYLRAKNNEVIYYIQGVRYVMINLDEAEFDLLVQTAGYNSYPTNFYVDLGPVATGAVPNMYVWPPASGAYPWTVRYFPQMADITTPETSATVPWFPLQTYLITRLAGELMRDTDDDRAAIYLGDSSQGGVIGAQAILNKYLKMKDDPEGRVKTVTLDRRRFGPAFNGLKNTKLVGW